ncbi:MAG: bifunctional rhamnulose-1-phosphate aldolase/short-chain dehydrogenase [Fimbriimonadaceae bacterium]
METALPRRGWDRAEAAGLDDLGRLVLASNLLGSDPTVTNVGGGNTSVKAIENDPLTGEPVEVLWVKGSGGDLGTARRESFASLLMARLLAIPSLVESQHLHEDEVVRLYGHCTFGGNPVACSIDTALHAYVPAKAVSHMHADAVIAIAASTDAEKLCREVWGQDMFFLPWKRPGYELGRMLAQGAETNPGARGALMGQHGFICWDDDWEECYSLTLDIIERAQRYLDEHGRPEPLGPASARPPSPDWNALLPRLRGLTAYEGRRLVCHVDDSEEALAFLDSERGKAMARLGTSCPDHFLRTKVRPLWLEPGDLDAQFEQFRADYRGYYSRCKRPDSPAMRNPNPSLVLVPGGGIVGWAREPREARITTEFFRNAIRVMAGAEAVSNYQALNEQEAFDIEYWALEEAKLRRMPPEKELSRTVTVLTGAAQGIGRATAMLMAQLGSCVVMLDRDANALDQTVEAVREVGVTEGVVGVPTDVTDDAALARGFEEAVRRFGGVDTVIVNAGVARRGKAAETAEADYDLLASVLMRAYWQSAALGIRVLERQALGGSIVFVASKNGVATGSNAAIYSAAKAFELHLARTIAVDYASQGIRANSVNPDAVLTGSGIWSAEWREQTATALGIRPDELEGHYRDRSLLRREVLPEHVAEAVAWLASDARSSRTTGCTIPVDGGNREGFLR